jgi:HPt (histidine-containing phosphotransfer) domain-containing protein
MTIETTGAPPLYSTIANDPDLGELVDLFVSELPERVGNLQSALDRGDSEELGRYAHQLKGAAGSYGFGQLTPALKRLELLGREQATEEALRAALEEVKDLCARVRGGMPS